MSETMAMVHVAAKNPVSVALVERLPDVVRFLAPGTPRDQFLDALVHEANLLAMAMDKRDLACLQTQRSFLLACFHAACVGLLPGPQGLCYFIPFRLGRGKASEHTAISYVPGYRGLLQLAFQTRFLVSVSTEVVLSDEPFERGHTEDGPWIRHEIPLVRKDVERDTLLGAYCTYRTRSGGKGLEFMSRQDVAKVDTKRNVWRSDFAVMVRKSTVRRAAKWWQTTRELSAAITLDEQADRDEQQSLPQVLDAESVRQPDEPIDLDQLEVPEGADEE